MRNLQKHSTGNQKAPPAPAACGNHSTDQATPHYRPALRFLDNDNDGYITRDDLIVTMKTLNPADMDDQPITVAVQTAERMLDLAIALRPVQVWGMG